ENKIIGCCWQYWHFAGGGAAVGASRLLGGIRLETAREAARNSHPMGIGESPLLDSHRREKRGRHCHQLDDRGWQPQRPAQARLRQKVPAARNRDRRGGLSGQGPWEYCGRQEHYVSRWEASVPGRVGKRTD